MASTIKRIVFWQNVLSIHQSAFLRALAGRQPMEVWFAYEEDLPESRRNMGWTTPDYGAVRIVDARDADNWDHLAAMSDSGTCHVFGSYFILPRARAAFKHLRTAPCLRVWISEAFDFHGVRGWLRMQRTRWHVWLEAQKSFQLVFPMGGLGMRFFRQAGMPANRLREFGYLVEPPGQELKTGEAAGLEADYQFVYVGQLIQRKGVDLLLRALRQLPPQGWSLRVIGDGPERGALAEYARKSGVASRLHFLGNLSNEQTRAEIQNADALVLPSRWDGWGAVVNEALMTGTPVVVSQACGAASLVMDTLCGETFARNDVSGLARSLAAMLRRGRTHPENRSRLCQWAASALGGAQLADYFLACLESPRQLSGEPPWRTDLELVPREK